jgi:hypothetical protein
MRPLGLPENLIIALNPLIVFAVAMVILRILSKLHERAHRADPRSVAQANSTKKSQFYAETIQAEVKLCRFCGRDLVVSAIS